MQASRSLVERRRDVSDAWRVVSAALQWTSLWQKGAAEGTVSSLLRRTGASVSRRNRSQHERRNSYVS